MIQSIPFSNNSKNPHTIQLPALLDAAAGFSLLLFYFRSLMKSIPCVHPLVVGCKLDLSCMLAGFLNVNN